MDPIERAFARAKAAPRRIVLPEAGDARVRAAAQRLEEEGLATPMTLGGDAPALDAATLDRLAAALVAKRPRFALEEARAKMDDPLWAGAMLVATEAADVLVAGAATATADVVRAGLRCIGTARGVKTASSCFLIDAPAADGGRRRMIFADCGLVIDPDADALADIAIASAATAEKLFQEKARVAMISFSTHGSAAHAHVDKVRSALAKARAAAPDLAIEGEMQIDAALVPEVARKKLSSDLHGVGGRANVLVFPDLDAGNAAYKLAQRLGGATAIGPLLQGFARPIADLSRGASTDDIVTGALITALLGE